MTKVYSNNYVELREDQSGGLVIRHIHPDHPGGKKEIVFPKGQRHLALEVFELFRAAGLAE